MEIVCRGDDGFGLAPAALSIIRRTPAGRWHHREHQVFEPLTTYARALDKICTAWGRCWHPLLTLQSQLRFNLPPDAGPEVEQSYTALLHALNEHIDACFSVMRCAAPMPPGSSGFFGDRVVRTQRLANFSQFDHQVVEGYRKQRLGAAINAIKHSGARMRFVFGRAGGDVVLGYFIDGQLPSGAIGPTLRVHVDGNSAFSFNRDMLLHFWWLYRSSELMAAVLCAAVGHPTAVDATPADNASASPWPELCARIAALSADFLPDEMTLPYPLVVYDPTKAALKMRFPSGRLPRRPQGPMALTALLTLDAPGQPYKIPYMGRDEVTVEGH